MWHLNVSCLNLGNASLCQGKKKAVKGMIHTKSAVICTVRAMQKGELISPEAYCLLGAGQVRICALRYCFSDRLKCNALFFLAA